MTTYTSTRREYECSGAMADRLYAHLERRKRFFHLVKTRRPGGDALDTTTAYACMGRNGDLLSVFWLVTRRSK
jgi:hypothetical protein